MSINKISIDNSFKKIIIFFLLSILIIIYAHKYIKYKNLEIKNEFIKKNQNFENLCKSISTTRPVINNYKLYNCTDNPFLTLVFNFSYLNMNLNIGDMKNFMRLFSEREYKNIQIVFLNDSSNHIFENNENNLFFKEKRIEKFKFEYQNWTKSFISLMNKIKGKFLIMLDNIVNLEKNELDRIYNITKGSIQNIFKLEYKNNNCFYYLIRTKIIKDIIDSEISFNNYNDIINLIYEQTELKFNYIHIVFCPNNYYSYLAYTSMISILVSKNIYTYILFYLIITKEFDKNNIKLIESLYEQFDYFNISFIIMDNRYEKAYTRRYITKNAFFRLSLGELLPNLDKIIYLDADTICLKDLSNLYNLNFMGKIFLAKINTFKEGDLNFTVNTGVLLLNLIKMRKMEIEKKVISLLNNGFRHPVFHDQAIINLYYKKYIGFLPTEYNTFTFSYKNVVQYKKDSGGLYDFDSLYFSFKFPSIIHYRGAPHRKIYKKEDWYYFARKSKYFKKSSRNFSNIFEYSI